MNSKTIPFALLSLLCIAALGGCANTNYNTANVDTAQLAPQAARITDEAIHADQQRFTALQARHQALNARSSGQANRLSGPGSYGMAKAQCWMDVAFHEYHRNDRSAFPQAALGEAETIIKALENNQTVPRTTAMVDNSATLREDLWAKAKAIQALPGFICVEEKVACGEVQLVHAGHEANQGGWRYATPYARLAEDTLLAAEAEAKRGTCLPPPAPVPFPAPPPASIVPQPVRESITLLGDAVFVFGRSSQKDMKPGGKAQLDALATRVASAYSRVDRINITGHADRFGEAASNQALSAARAATVRAYLASKGLNAAGSTEGQGSSVPRVQCPGARSAAVVACLEPNRRVEIELVGVRK